MKIDILKCIVCGHTHANVRVDKLPEPIMIQDRDFTHACACKLTGDIIYVKFISDTVTDFAAKK